MICRAAGTVGKSRWWTVAEHTAVRYTLTGFPIPVGHAALHCGCRQGYTDPACESLRTTPPCSHLGCGKPTAYLPSPDGYGWRHVAPDDETPSHIGHPGLRGEVTGC